VWLQVHCHEECVEIAGRSDSTLSRTTRCVQGGIPIAANRAPGTAPRRRDAEAGKYSLFVLVDVNSSLQSETREWAAKLDFVRHVYGSHMAMRLATEKAVFSEPVHLPGIPSSRIALQTVLGTDTTIDFSDFLNSTLQHTLFRTITAYLCTQSRADVVRFVLLQNHS
jgi:hypothetical protein